MKKNNKGFTMMEILGAIIIMGVLLMIAVPAVSKLMKGFREEYYSDLEKTIVASAKDFYSDNKIYRPDGLLKSSYTSIKSLIGKKYVDKLVDYNGKACSLEEKESYVIVINKGKDKYEYHTCIKCGEEYASNKEGTYCDSAWLTNDNIKYEIGEKEELYIYHETPREEVREKLLNNISIVKYNKKGAALDRVKLDETNIEGVLPVDIDKLDTFVKLDSSNKKEVILNYEIEKTSKQIKTIIYKHKEPIIEIEDAKGNTYNGSYWTSKVIVTLKTNDGFYELSNTSVGSFQLSINNGVWQNIDCDMKSEATCSIVIDESVDAEYKFRIVTNEGKISDETENFIIKIDVEKPVVNITPNGDEPIVYVGSTTGELNFNLTTSDTGGSGIKSRKYAISTSSTTAPTTFTNFYIDSFDVSQSLEGSGIKYYVWAQVEDNAGNISEGVWPSNEFTMKYEVRYDSNGGAGSMASDYVKYGDAFITKPNAFSRTGYIFNGWKEENGTVWSLEGDGVKRDKEWEYTYPITLYAQWTPKTYTVTYHGNGGLYNGSETWVDNERGPAIYGQPYTTWSNNNFFVRNGYSFAGWIDQNGTNWTNDIDNPWVWSYDYDVTLYAQWTPNTYAVTYDANGGTGAPAPTYFTFNSNAYLSTTVPTRAGYTFANWSYAGYAFEPGGTIPLGWGSFTLVAQWVSSKSICDYSGDELFGTGKGNKTGVLNGQIIQNYGQWYSSLSFSYTCASGNGCTRSNGYDRICVSDYCGSYKGKTAKEINDSASCEFANYWCSCNSDGEF